MTDRPNIIAITGGIGSGKSIVSKVLDCLGYNVYDCDSEAKRIMDSSIVIQSQLSKEIHPDAVTDGIINRKLISDVVFQDSQKLSVLNRIVHTAVTEDILARSSKLKGKVLFVESAILYQSKLDKIVQCVWEVTASIDTRIARVMNRNSFTRQQVLARIESQESFKVIDRHPSTYYINNDGNKAILPQIYKLIDTCLSR